MIVVIHVPVEHDSLVILKTAHHQTCGLKASNIYSNYTIINTCCIIPIGVLQLTNDEEVDDTCSGTDLHHHQQLQPW